MATGAAPMRPKAGLIRDLLEGSFPELYPPPEPEPEPEEGAGEAPPEDDAERPSTPELDAYQKRMAEIDAKVRARAGPNLGRNHRSNRTFQKRVPFFFFCQNAANQPRSSPSPHAPPAS